MSGTATLATSPRSPFEALKCSSVAPFSAGGNLVSRDGHEKVTILQECPAWPGAVRWQLDQGVVLARGTDAVDATLRSPSTHSGSRPRHLSWPPRTTVSVGRAGEVTMKLEMLSGLGGLYRRGLDCGPLPVKICCGLSAEVEVDNSRGGAKLLVAQGCPGVPGARGPPGEAGVAGAPGMS